MTPRSRGVFLAAVMLTLATGAGVAHAASDDPTPYTVTADGITLPAGVTFPAHGHVNWRTTSSSGGIHFDPNNNQPGGAYIGKSFLPIPLAPGECITWVQVSLYDEHYGEGGQEPICKPTTTPAPTEEPTWTPEPTDTPTTAAPSESPTTTPSSEPSEPTPTGSTPTTPSPQPSEPETTPPVPPTEPTPPPSEQPEPSATPDPTDTPTTPTPIQPDPEPSTGHSQPPSLAVTGSNDPLVGTIAFLACVLLGAYLYLTNHRRKP